MNDSECSQCNKFFASDSLLMGRCPICRRSAERIRSDDNSQTDQSLMIRILLITSLVVVGITFFLVYPLNKIEIGDKLSSTNMSAVCQFWKHSAAKSPNGSAEDFNKGTTKLAFTKGITTQMTQGLDGSIRATNSLSWYQLSSNYNGTTFAGSDGDLLMIAATPSDSSGRFLATLQWSIKDLYAFTSMGRCDFTRF